MGSDISETNRVGISNAHRPMVSQLAGRPSVPVQRQGLITHHNPGRC
jgi:hypothetical protein